MQFQAVVFDLFGTLVPSFASSLFEPRRVRLDAPSSGHKGTERCVKTHPTTER